MAGALRRAGVGPGDRVAILAPNTPAHLVAHFAMPRSARRSSRSTRASTREIAYILDHCGAKVLLVESGDSRRRSMRSLPERQVTPARDRDTDGMVRRGPEARWERVREGRAGAARRDHVDDEESVISINYTSGTTGMRRRDVHASRRVSQRLSRSATRVEALVDHRLDGPDVPLQRMEHAVGVHGRAGKHVCLRKVEPAEIFRLIDEEGIIHLNGAPTVLLVLASDPAAQGKHFDPPIHTCKGGAPPSPTWLDRWRARREDQSLYGTHRDVRTAVTCELQDGWEKARDRRAARS